MKGRTGEENQGCIRGHKACTPGIPHEMQGNLSLEAFGEVQWTVP